MQIEEAVERYKSGTTVLALARHYKTSGPRIAAALRSRGCDVRRGRERISTADKERMIEEYRNGTSYKTLGEMFGMTPWAASQILERAGVRTAKWQSWTPKRYDELRQLVAEGLTQREVVERLGIKRSALGIRLRHIGVPSEPARSRERHGAWKGGRIVIDGYIYVRPTTDDLRFCVPNASGYVAEHRLNMGRKLGRPLLRTETVHHKNLKHDDNRIRNLQLRQGQHGTGAVIVCGDCGSHNVIEKGLV